MFLASEDIKQKQNERKRCWLHSCRMLILLAEYGLVHRDDCINCETCYFCFDLDFVWPSLVNPFRVFVRVPDLAGDARQ